MPTSKPHSITKFVIDFASSAIGGVVAKTVVAPLDRVKIILQIRRGLTEKYGELLPHLPKNKKTFTFTLKDIIQKQGIPSLWRGNVSNIVRYVPSQVNICSQSCLVYTNI
uniref:Adp atp transporter on adenylate translocase n=1 Tax=Triatoma infestans TaxID=30076 RepID=A0A161ME68_TRIIF